MTDDRTRGVHLSDKQLVFVFMAATVVAVVVFLCGVLVGRGVQDARGPLTGGGTMAASDVVSDGTPAEAPVADGVPRPESGGAGGGEKFTYPELLGKTPPAEQGRAGAAAAGPAAGTPAPPEVPADAVSAPADPAPAAAAPAASVMYTVQVAAVKQRSEADAIAKHLKAKGYEAFVLAPEGSDRAGVFRVRIGSFKDKRQADLLAERLLRDDKRYKPWVTR